MEKKLGKILLSLEKEGWTSLIQKDRFTYQKELEDNINSLFGKNGLLFEIKEWDIPKQWHIAILSIDLSIIQLIDLALISTKEDYKYINLIWPNHHSTPIQNNFVLEIFSTSLANTLISVRKLILTGFDSQAKILLRWFVELADTTNAILDNLELYQCCLKEYDNFDISYRDWRKYLTPKKIKKMLFIKEKSFGLSESIIHNLSEIREGTYKWLSQFTHINWVSQVISCYAMPLKGKIYKPSVCGIRSKKSIITLIYAAFYSYLFLLRLQHQLSVEHDWNKLAGDSRICHWMFRFKVIEKNFLLNHKKLKEHLNMNKPANNLSGK